MPPDFKKIPLLRTPPVSVNARAFSLVEVVLAIGIFAFAALAIVALLGQGMKTSRDARLESVAALLSGKVNSTLRASSAWGTPTPDAGNFMGGKSLTDIAQGFIATNTFYYDITLSNVLADSADRQFAMKVRVEPFTTANFQSTNAVPDAMSALSSLTNAANTVLLNVEVSYPALATNEANRSKRYFSSIITRTSTN